MGLKPFANIIAALPTRGYNPLPISLLHIQQGVKTLCQYHCCTSNKGLKPFANIIAAFPTRG